MTSRRGFFEHIVRMTDDPRKLRAKKIEELRAWAYECAPLEWENEQREEVARTVENKLTYLSDETLQGEGMKKYVESIVRDKEMFFAARRAEEDYVRRNPYVTDDYENNYEENE
jgi:hypothetical protein